MIESAKATSFLEIDDIYVQCAWSHPSANTEIIAIFRDITPNNNISNFLMDQPLRGPWRHSANDLVIDQPAFRACSILAMEMFTDLNHMSLDIVKAKWIDNGGVVYDY